MASAAEPKQCHERRNMAMTAYYIERSDRPWLVGFDTVSHSAIPSSSPASNIDLELLAEGGANFVFRLYPGDDPLPERLKGKLLRLRKDLPHSVNAEEQLRALDDSFRDLLPAHHLLHHELISLSATIPTTLNAALQHIVRPGHRARDVLPEEEITGMLVTDMTPASRGDTLVEFKPKWLTQSPNAPLDAVRCRTCAVRAHRTSLALHTATDAQALCPLSFVHADPAQRLRSAWQLISSASCSSSTSEALAHHLAHNLQPLLQQLRACQLALDPHGVLHAARAVEPLRNLCKAMTLRDCTLFLLMRSDGSIDARLGDLDLKQPAKLPRWRKMELDLVEGGWYTNTEDARVWRKEKICLLSSFTASK